MDDIKRIYLDVLKNKFAKFDGRASRREYWTFTLSNVVICIILSVIDRSLLGAKEYGFLSLVFSLIVLIPGLAVMIRRLHDTDRSGWWLILAFVPLAGLVLLAFACFDGTRGANRFGEDPKGNII